MNTVIGYVIGIAYIVGLLVTAWGDAYGVSRAVGAIAPLLASMPLALILPRIWRKGPRAKVWAIAGLVASFASLYLQLRLPVATTTPLQAALAPPSSSTVDVVCVHGKILDSPQINRSGRFRFRLKAETVYRSPDAAAPCDQVSQAIAPQILPRQDILYVTTAAFENPVLFPSLEVGIRGTLYTPSAAKNPGGFDFRAYLARQGIFTGLAGQWVQVMRPDQTPPLPWRLRRRLVNALETGLGTPAGTLLSAMVLGRRAVDLPADLRAAFTKAGLAHTLAASGFHVSLLLGLVLALSARLDNRDRVVISGLILLAYITLTGLQPSVIRAAVMGLTALTAPLVARKTRPLAVLLWVAVLMLVVSPLWIWNLGFQFSFLATLGLIVTVPPLVKRLDWIPPAIATVLAVPMAAILWTLPLQLFVFGVFPPYSLLLNVITTPLIILVSLGGMVSAAAAVVVPALGSLLAGLLYFPIQLLIAVVRGFNQLPYSSFAAGSLSSLQLLLIYGLFGLFCMGRGQYLRILTGAIALGVAVIPGWYLQFHSLRLTVLAADRDPVLVVQDHGVAGVIGQASEATLQFTLQPFLSQQGINQLNWAVSLTPDPAAWLPIQQAVAVQTLYAPASQDGLSPQAAVAPGTVMPLLPDQPLGLGSLTVQLAAADPIVLKLRIDDQSWLVMNAAAASPDPATALAGIADGDWDVLWWPGHSIDPSFLTAVQPQTAIASADQIDTAIQNWFGTQNVPLFVTGIDGAVQWTAAQGLRPALASLEDGPI